VSDPSCSRKSAPRVSGGVAHAMAVAVTRGRPDTRVNGAPAPHIVDVVHSDRGSDLRDDRGSFASESHTRERTSFAPHLTPHLPEDRTVAVGAMSTAWRHPNDRVCGRVRDGGHHAVDPRAVLGTVLEVTDRV
jgi:hypothetical protein